MVEALADALGVRPKFLLNQIPSTVRPEQCHFRKQQTTPASVTSQVLARGTVLDRAVQVLDSYLELPALNFPEIVARSLAEIEEAAEAAREHWGLGLASPIVSMMRVVENAGAVVTYFGDLSERVDAFSMDRRRPVIVRSSLKESLCRQRFDLAHECGHLIMHRGLQTGDRTTEEQAHRFASAFLLPRTAMVREYPRRRRLDWHALFEMKLRWKVSVRALIRRGYDLGLLDAVQYRTANIHMVKSGQAKTERYDDELPVEQPELLASALEAMTLAHFRSTRQLADEVGLSDEMFEWILGHKLPPEPIDPQARNVVPLMRRPGT